ncbi:MAG: aldehyde ferredoxin oxidoreductase family protein [Thermoplasmatota archaeon]
MHGWWNKLAILDLESRDISYTKIGNDILKSYLGGRGLGTRLLVDEITPEEDPLKNNVLIFTAGPLTGTSVLTSGRFSATSKSPLTGTICDSNVGGYFGHEFKKCGIDGLIIRGRSEEPCIIKIRDDKINIDKTKLWGKSTGETLSSLDGKSAVIGPSGENLVKYANIVTNDFRVFGRGGLGAVMGSKKLKGISCKGSKDVSVADRESLIDFIKKAFSKIDSSPVTSRGLRKFGTPILVNLINWLGMFSEKNFRSCSGDKADKLSGETMKKEIVRDHYGCYGCPIRCGLKTKTEEAEGKGPEYESVWALGANLGIYDLERVTELNYLCNELGLDTISTGGTLACAMEMREEDVWDKTDGFGSKNIKKLIKKISEREGVGNELAEGSSRLCENYGCNYSMSVKNLELPAYDPRGASGQALSFATSNRGGCHLRGYMIGEEIFGVPKLFDRFKTDGKAEVVKRSQERNAYLDSLIVCKFSSFALSEEYYSRFLKAVTGIKYTVSELHKIGERIYNLERKFNVEAGFGRDDDYLPKRFSNPLKTGSSSGNTFNMDKLLDNYYEVMGWNQKGVPKKETLRKLNILHLHSNITQ